MLEIHVQHVGGAVARIPVENSAFAHREVQFFVNLIGVVEEQGHLAAMREGIRALYDKASVEALPGILANFSDQDDTDKVRQFGRPYAERLAALRHRYDPAGTLAVF